MTVPLCLFNLRMSGQTGDCRYRDTFGEQQRAECMAHGVEGYAACNSASGNDSLQGPVGRRIVAEMGELLYGAVLHQ